MTRLLFVDDESRVLEGLRLSLRSKRKVWEMVFLDGGAAALADLEKQPADVVVSDMRMPGMDGAELLARVAALRPETVRIILSGQMDETAAVRAASVAHRFLSKPCDATTLESSITSALQLRDWLQSDRLRSCVGGVESLPSLPQVYVELNHALTAPEVSMSAIAKIIESDPGMAAKVLQLVNSSFFGLSRNMVNIGQAVSYIGVSTMKNLVLADSLFHKLGSGDVASAERERERSLLRARVARRLITPPSSAEAASTAALLLHIGTLTLQSRMPEEHATHIADAKERALPIHEVERELLGVTHAEVGAYLLGLWGLPHEIIVAVATHHAPWTEVTTLDVGAAVHIAEALVSSALPSASEDQCPEPPVELLQQLGVADAVDRQRAEIAAALGQ